MQMSCLKWCCVAEHGVVNGMPKQSQFPGNPLSHWPGQVRVGDGTRGNRVGSLNSNSETHINARYDARLIYGRGGFHGYL